MKFIAHFNLPIVLKNMSSYTLSAVFAQGLGFISSFVVARLLGPTDYGIWNLASLVLVYGSYFDFGVLPALGRELPILLGQGDFDQVKEVESAAFTSTLVSSVAVALVVFTLSFFPNVSSKIALSLRGLSITLVVMRMYGYYITVLRSYNEFNVLSKLQALLAVCNTLFIVVGVINWGLDGRVLAGLLAQAFLLFYVIRMRTWAGHFSINAPLMWRLVQVGVPIIISSTILGFLTTIDRLVIASYLGETKLGYFGLALLVTSFVALVPVMSMQVLYPKMSYAYGASGKQISTIRQYIEAPPILLGYVLPLMIGPLYILLPSVVQKFLPDYSAGVAAARIVLIGIYFYNLLGLTDYFLVVTGRLKQYIIFCGLALILDVMLDYIFILLGWDIVGIALGGTVITYLLYAVMIIVYVHLLFSKNIFATLSYLGMLLIPFFIMLAILGCLGFLDNYFGEGQGSPGFLLAGIDTLIFWVAWGLILFLQKKYILLWWHKLSEV